MADPLVLHLRLPSLACSPNGSHGHWSRKASGRKEQRDEARFLAMNKGLVASKVKVDAVFFCGRQFPGDGLYRPTDVQNAIASLKGAIDGLKDAGVIVDDDHRHLEWGKVILARTKKEHCGRQGVVLTITAVE